MSLRSIFTKSHYVLMFCLAAWLGLIAAASAQTVIERLVSPGPLSKAHQELQKDCGACHVSFKKEAQTALCLDCHEDVAADVQRQRGFHGKSPDIDGKPCKTCHTEHEGDYFSIVTFDAAAFDHALTDYALKGGHSDVACNQCHSPNKKFRQAPLDCATCHESDEPHKGRLGTDCQSCHNVNDWNQVDFDHSTTKFSLSGKHRQQKCQACHVDERYKDLPSKCIDCHIDDDTHAGSFGAACDDCHNANSWLDTGFNHRRKTGFALSGRHAAIDCKTCHTVTLFKPKLKRTCIGCHRDDDPHKGGQGENCSACHNETSWTKNTRFDHDLSRFPLLGEHKKIECDACHFSKRFKEAQTDCAACHDDDDKHKGALGQDCGLCHNPNDWALWIFDHDTQSNFQLTGAHEGLSCASCHRAQKREGVSQSSECIACHRADDKHRGEYGSDCARCHTTEDFKRIRYP
jgi:hypothetical protein